MSPHFPILGEQVDNKKRGFFEEGQFNQLLEKLPGYLHPYVKFLYATGMRSGRAAQLKWDMVNEKKTELHIPGELIKNKEDFSLPLVYADGRTIKGFEFRNNERRIGEQIFDVTDFRSQWRQACDAQSLAYSTRKLARIAA
jgi:integrase